MREWRPSGIPLLPGPLVGRDAELRAARELLLEHGARLVTLTGPPGVGKTSLALALAAELQDQFDDGVRFVDLSTVTDPELVATVMADSLGAGAGGGVAGGAGPMARLIAFLADRSRLLVVDNFEQVIGAAPLIAELLRTCRALTVLATSRAALRLRWEWELPIAPLELPERTQVSAPEALEHLPAIRLFVVRARAVRPDFSLTPANAAAVAEVCRKLDGLPLAIELAAARARVLTPEAMLEQLTGAEQDAPQGWSRTGLGLDVLTGGARDLPRRQQALSTAIDWSYALLDDDERTLFRRLAVFVGGCTLEAVQAVAGAGTSTSGPGDTQDHAPSSHARQLTASTLDLVASLVEKNLLRQEHMIAAEPRLRMLETIRAYAVRALAASDEAEPVRAHHAAFYLELAELAAPRLEGAEQAAWLDRLDGERDNLRATARWAAERGDAETVLRLGAALWPFWWARSDAAEARERVEGILSLAALMPPSPARVRALHGAGVLAHELADYGEAEILFEQSLRTARQIDDRQAIGDVLNSHGWMAQQRGDFASARVLLDQSLEVARQLDDPTRLASTLSRRGYVAFAVGDIAEARTFLDEALVVARQVDDQRIICDVLYSLGLTFHAERDLVQARRFFEESRAILTRLAHRPALAQTLHSLGAVATMERDFPRARALYREVLLTARGAGNQRRLALVLWAIAVLVGAEGEPAWAVRLHTAGTVAIEALGVKLARPLRELNEANVAPAYAALGEDEVTAARALGRTMTLEQAVDEALTWLSDRSDDARAIQAVTHPAAPAADGPAVGIAQSGHESEKAGRPAPLDDPRSTPLTQREREIAALIGRGLTSREIAQRLVIGKGTVDAHADHIRDKLDLHSRAEIAAWAVRHGLL